MKIIRAKWRGRKGDEILRTLGTKRRGGFKKSRFKYGGFFFKEKKRFKKGILYKYLKYKLLIN